jgi:hypothetical protein
LTRRRRVPGDLGFTSRKQTERVEHLAPQPEQLSLDDLKQQLS